MKRSSVSDRVLRLAIFTVVLFGMAATAEAGAITTPITLEFSGTVQTGWDSSKLFGGGSLTGNTFTASITFDPNDIGKNSCGSSTSTTSCNWSASGHSSFTQTLTMMAGGKSFTQEWTGSTGSSLSVSSSGADAMYLWFGGSGYSFSLNLVSSSPDAFFADQKNVNSLSELYFEKVALNQKSTAEYGSSGSTSFTLQFETISVAGKKSGEVSEIPIELPIDQPSAVVPEPATIAVFALGLLGLAFMRRRPRGGQVLGSRT